MNKKKVPIILYVSVCKAKLNKMFSEEQRQAVLFLIYNQFICCTECGKKRKRMWTMLCQFKAASCGPHSLDESNKSHPPLTPVCQDHPLLPDWPKT